MSVAFQGKALYPFENSYQRATADISLLVIHESAIQCSAPLTYAEYFFEDVKDPADYSCTPDLNRTSSDLPFSYRTWNEKWYSPVCRDWYKLQVDNPTHGVDAQVFRNIACDCFTFTSC